MNEIIKDLSKPLPAESIQRTKGTETKKGYDTTGYGYQYAVDRFNDILDEKWGFNWEIINETTGTYKKSGFPYVEITIKMYIWINNKENERSCVGGHTATNYADALKGAITNGFKKTAAFWGVGRDAFAGTIDDDNKPLPDKDSEKEHVNSKELAKKQYDDFYNSLDEGYQFELKDMTDAERFKLFVKCEWNIKKLDEEITNMAKALGE